MKIPQRNPLQKLIYYIKLYLFYLKIYVKIMVEYRIGTWLALIASILAQLTAIAFINILFSKIPIFYYWKFPELLFLFGIAITGRALTQVFMDMPYFLPFYITQGQLDVILVRPPSPLFQTIGMTQEINALGTLITGIFILFYAGIQTSINWNFFTVFYLIIALISSMLIQFSFLLTAIIPSFWVMDSRSLIYPFGWLMDFLRYPIDVFHPVLRFILIYIIPYSLGSYYPVLFLLRPHDYPWALWAVPLTGIGCFFIAINFWNFGLKHYSSAG